jgi:hypothetical protein
LGDFDYNGFVDDDDVTLLGAFYDPAAAPIPTPLENSSSSASALRVAVVPEPATIILLLAMCLCSAGTIAARKAISRVIVFRLLVLNSTTALRAAPLLNLWLEARKQGSAADFISSVNVAIGDTLEYRLRVDLAPIGTSNDYFGIQVTINELRPGIDGINSLSFLTLTQSPFDDIQVHLDAPVELTTDSLPDAGDGRNAHFTASAGVSRSRGNAWNDVERIRAIHAPGVVTGIEPETVFTGTMTVVEVSGPSAQLSLVAADAFAFGMRINNKSDALFLKGPHEDPTIQMSASHRSR